MDRLFLLCITLVFVNLTSSALIRQTPSSLTSHPSRDQPQSRLSLADSAEWTEYYVREPEGPGTYSFGYDVEDEETGNVQFRTEEKSANGTVSGSYGFLTPEGYIHMVHYIADHLGYRTKIENGRKSALSNILFKTQSSPYNKMSPTMLKALQSLQNYKRLPKEEQHLRPADQIKTNSNYLSFNNNQETSGIVNDYSVNFVPHI